VERAETIRAPGDRLRLREAPSVPGVCISSPPGRVAGCAPLSGEGDTTRTSGGTGGTGTGQMVQAPGCTEEGTPETATGATDRPGGGLLEKEEKALVGILLCLVDVRGDACMCSKRLGGGAAHGIGKRACIGVFPEKLPCIEVRKLRAIALLSEAEISTSHSSFIFRVSVDRSAWYFLAMKHAWSRTARKRLPMCPKDSMTHGSTLLPPEGG
jgi:hypothetical protein